MPDEKNLQNEHHTETTLHENYLVIRVDRKHYKINYEDLIFIEGQKAYVTFHTITNRVTTLASLCELEEKLPKSKFLRIHKSYVVSISKIIALDGTLVKSVIMFYQ